VDGRIDLGRLAGREVEITLATDTDGAPVRIAGRPAWSRLRVVREAWLERQPASAGAPSVLVLLVDALRADRLGCYGAVPSPSPALDRLARGALVFDTAIAAASWTMPSVATLLTGVYPRTHGVVGVGEAGDPAERHDAGASFLPGAFVTLAEHAARAGITTVGVSANPLVSRATNYAQGFETFLELEWDPPRGHMPGARDVNDAFLRWLAPNRGVRFLGYLHYMDPHDPYAPPRHLRPPPPQGIRPAVANGNVFTLARQLDWRGGSPLPGHEIAYLRALYDAEIQAWDAGLAQLLEALDELGVGRSTVVIVTADHGEEFQEHGLLKHGRHLYEETLRVPLLIAGRGIRPGRAAEPAQGIDLFPTVAALLGAPAPAALPGRDLLTTPPPRPAFSETRYGALPRAASGPLQSVRTAGWKLIHAPTADHFELYDLAQDPAERTNRWGVAPEGAELAALLGSWRPPPPPAPAEGIDPALPRKLRALGYVE
jgi:arylsulfatase A-like enzyme